MRYDWVLFDVDGTLFDYDAAEAKALAGAFSAFGLPYAPATSAVYREINARIWEAFERGEIAQSVLRWKRFALLFEALGLQADPAGFSARYLELLALGSDLMPGAEETVRALQGRVGLHLITNGLREVQRSRFARSSIGGCFSGMVISEEVGASKPDGRIFDVAFEQMGRPPRERVLIVGDSLTSDIRGGNDYGIDTCWFNPAHRERTVDVEPRYEVDRLGTVLGLVGLAR